MNIQKVIKKDLCLGCGICLYDSNINKMEYSSSKGMYIPKLDHNKDYTLANAICPGKGYNIYKNAKELYNNNYTIDLGFVDSKYIAHSNIEEVLKNASSGGIMSQILLYLLEEKIVDKVAVTKFIYTTNGPKTKTIITSDIKEILNSQGSKYCPVDISSFINDLKNFKGTLAYIGTPCQIAGIRNIQKLDSLFKEKIKLTIANFCGGFKNYNNIKKIAKHHNISFKNITYFQFRGGGQPGSLKMIDKRNYVFQTPYPKYTSFTGYSKILRCHLCIDATGELADIACGDAWLDKCLNDEKAWSIIICRSKNATQIIQNMKEKKVITTDYISYKDICHSQRINLKSKKYRYLSRNKLYHFLGYTLPIFDGGYQQCHYPNKIELKIYITHKIKELIEKMDLYKYCRILMRKKY
ncbi:MAG: Coenzyme F420 hydrogenase/dehydrogenase, beta subunit C-terminal domain [Bacteroides sp.]|jgi:coenzyme F420 hydrogenase subunit beta|nr:Coenzyme F420 hydrogenase/dehydrogenase, beta subunit C-terminal domain [Bacteroides sp.]